MKKELDTISLDFEVELLDYPKRNAFPSRKGKPEMYRFGGGYYSFNSQGQLEDCHYKYANFEKTTLGHSLGAALCQVASMKTGIQAMAYNPAGLHRNTISNLGLTNAPTSQIQNYVINGDGVNLSNVITPNVIVPGTTNYRTTLWSVFLGYSISGCFINHKSSNF